MHNTDIHYAIYEYLMPQFSDLNLLPALHLLLQERNVSRAAMHIGLSQSAMSRVLAKLREQFSDELLVRTGMEYQLTPKARQLIQQLNRLMPELQQLHQHQIFCPEKAEQTVTISGTDLDVLLLSQHIHAIQAQAPNLVLSFKQTKLEIIDTLLNGDLDFAITVADDQRSGLHRSLLWQQSFAVVVDANNPLSDENFTLSDYLAHKHGMFQYSKSSPSLVDVALAQLNKKRHITLRLSNFGQIPALLIGSQLMFTVPVKFAHYLAEHYALKVLPLPIDVIHFSIYLYWHHRLHKSPLHQWVKDRLVRQY